MMYIMQVVEEVELMTKPQPLKLEDVVEVVVAEAVVQVAFRAK